ncbi:hypothetical protein I4U23_026292 [Adineta vaga]|nr:hypothetical protein I4U23_026292 [Adineta vaga]
MTCTSSCENLIWSNTVYTPLVEWQKLLSKLTTREVHKGLSSKYDARRPSTGQYSSSVRKPERLILPKNHLIDDSFIPTLSTSLSSSIAQSSIDISRQVTTSARRYVSSFKTISTPLNKKSIQQTNSSNDHMVIFKLTKENTKENNDGGLRLSMKHSSLSLGTSSSTTTTRSSTPPPSKQSLNYSSSTSSTCKSSLTYKAEGLKRRTTHDSPVITSGNLDLSNMATSTTSHPSSNPSLYAYGSTITSSSSSSSVRQRALAETATNSLLITSERFKSQIPSSMRPARQSSTTTMPSTYMTSQQLQRNTSQNIRSRNQTDKSMNSKDLFEYSDPFTNCPQDILNKLAQLTKLQIETVEWERKRRFTKKKSGTNGITQGKDSP